MNAPTTAARANARNFNPGATPELPLASNSKTRSARASAPSGQSEKNNRPAESPVLTETVFRFDAPSAREVLLVAEFTQWDKAPVKLIKGGGGLWHTKIPLAPGRHLYRFLVDGEWRNDPACTASVPNPFGTTNSVVEISG